MAGIHIDQDAFDEARLVVVERALSLWSREGRGRGPRRDNQQALSKLKEIAGRAHPERILACHGLAEMLYNGAEGIPANNCESMKWYLEVLEGPPAHRAILLREGNRTLFIVVCNNMLEVGALIVGSSEEGEGAGVLHSMQEKLTGLRKRWKGTAAALVLLHLLGEMHWLLGHRVDAAKCFTKVAASEAVADATGSFNIINCIPTARRKLRMMAISEEEQGRAMGGETRSLDVQARIDERMQEVEREREEAREALQERYRAGLLSTSGLPVTQHARANSRTDTLNLKLQLKPGQDIEEVTRGLQAILSQDGATPSISVNGPAASQLQTCCGCGAKHLYLESCACPTCGDAGLRFCSAKCQSITWKAVRDSCPRHSALPPPPPPPAMPPPPPDAASVAAQEQEQQQTCCGCGARGRSMASCACTKCGAPGLRFCTRECQLRAWKAVRKSCPRHAALPSA